MTPSPDVSFFLFSVVAREGIDAHLIEHSDRIRLTPVLRDEARLDPVDVDAVQSNFRARRRDFLPDTCMRAARRYPGRDEIALGDHLLDPEVKVGEGPSQTL